MHDEADDGRHGWLQCAVIALLLAIAACGKASAPSNECASAFADVYASDIERVKDSLDPPEQQQPIAQIEKRRDAFAQRCTEDHWSAEVIGCIRQHHTSDDLTLCYRRLDVAQFEKLGELRETLRAPAVQAVLTKMRAFRDKMCACTNKGCADRVSEEMNRWGTQQNVPKEKFTEEDAKQMTAVSEDFSKCMTKIMVDAIGSAADQQVQ